MKGKIEKLLFLIEFLHWNTVDLPEDNWKFSCSAVYQYFLMYYKKFEFTCLRSFFLLSFWCFKKFELSLFFPSNFWRPPPISLPEIMGTPYNEESSPSILVLYSSDNDSPDKFFPADPRLIQAHWDSQAEPRQPPTPPASPVSGIATPSSAITAELWEMERSLTPLPTRDSPMPEIQVSNLKVLKLLWSINFQSIHHFKKKKHNSTPRCIDLKNRNSAFSSALFK